MKNRKLLRILAIIFIVHVLPIIFIISASLGGEPIILGYAYGWLYNGIIGLIFALIFVFDWLIND